jgi:hypothetical protein
MDKIVFGIKIIIIKWTYKMTHTSVIEKEEQVL